MKFYISQVTKFVISVEHLKLVFSLCSGGTPIADRMYVWFAYAVALYYSISKDSNHVQCGINKITFSCTPYMFFVVI
jgi:hypothetical protein